RLCVTSANSHQSEGRSIAENEASFDQESRHEVTDSPSSLAHASRGARFAAYRNYKHVNQLHYRSTPPFAGRTPPVSSRRQSESLFEQQQQHLQLTPPAFREPGSQEAFALGENCRLLYRRQIDDLAKFLFRPQVVAAH